MGRRGREETAPVEKGETSDALLAAIDALVGNGGRVTDGDMARVAGDDMASQWGAVDQSDAQARITDQDVARLEAALGGKGRMTDQDRARAAGAAVAPSGHGRITDQDMGAFDPASLGPKGGK